ncbi:MAG: sulfite exporter TauE/SafE family protein [Alphaproteobacteria bacterium]|nr:sulfite exporter TauE/SafE family protein [Alphaproteobacteria bacterium]
MSLGEAAGLVLAGLLGGALNAVAGGGSLVTFPALLATGLPPVTANATNTFSALPGYLASLWAYRRELARHRALVGRTVALSAAGGLAGAALLLVLPAEAFRALIPWLLLAATLLFGLGPRLTRALKGRTGPEAVHDGALLAVASYGGFFNAGLGILVLGALSLRGLSDVNEMNALKMLVSSAVAIAAALLFLGGGVLAFAPGLAVVAGTVIGGFLAARLARRLPQGALRAGILAYAAGLTAYWFWRVAG